MHLWMYLCMCACGCGRYVGLSVGLCVVWTRVFAFLGVGLCVSVALGWCVCVSGCISMSGRVCRRMRVSIYIGVCIQFVRLCSMSNKLRSINMLTSQCGMLE